MPSPARTKSVSLFQKSVTACWLRAPGSLQFQRSWTYAPTPREALYGGTTTNPTGAWTTQAARNLFLRHPQRLTHTRALLRDRASQFVNDFDEIFRTEGLKILRTPVRVPVANAFAERWIGTLRRKLLSLRVNMGSGVVEGP